MNFHEPPTTERSGFARPPEDIDRLLRAFFQAELPAPWPEMEAPASAGVAPAHATPRLRSLVRSRWALAASVALLAIGPWLVAGKFPTGARVDIRTGGVDVGQKNPSPAAEVPKGESRFTPPKVRR